jgi:DNA-binding CsgD family transcriptional regulator
MRKESRRLEPLLELIDMVYAAAVNEVTWSDLAPQIARTFDSTSTNLQIQRAGGTSEILSMTENVGVRINAYLEHYWQRDIWVERAKQNVGLSQVGASADIVTDVEFQDTEFYRDWCRHLDVFYVVGAVFPTGPNDLCVLGVHRPRQAGTYDREDKYWVSRFLPHLQRALRVRDRLGATALTQRLSLEALHRCETAALLVAADGRILFANERAECFLAEGCAFRARNQRLVPTRRVDAERFAILLHQACTGSQGEGAMTLRGASGRALSVLVAPFRLNFSGQAGANAIVFIRDPSRALSAQATLQALFGLTPTEARIAEALANGKTIPDIAAAHGAAAQTVRKQLKSIFAKTGTNRQATCVALILRSIAPMTAEPAPS